MLVVFGVLAVPSLWAGKHPVPLEAKADAATCLQCHEVKTKGKAVHSAIATGCLSCHEVRVNKDITRVKLTATTPVALCIGCHADKKAADIKGKVHSPAVRDCLKCHDPHSSENKNQLLKARSGATKDENLCLTCHQTGLKVPEKGSRHAALDMGCETCHVTHKTGDASKREFAYHLTKATPQLCIDCHDPKDNSIAKAHQNQPIAGSDCLTCHDPHQSQGAKLLQKFIHQPFGDKSCDTCHAAPKDGKVVLTQADSKALCVTCHAEQAEKIEKSKVKHAGAQGDCIACHDPHAGKAPGFLRPDPVAACTTCHTEQAELHKKKVLHQPVFKQGCAICHEPHGSDKPKLLRAERNGLCLECHGTNSKPGKVEGSTDVITIFNGKVRLPANYFAKNRISRYEIKLGVGHPTAKHPVEDVRDPLDQSKIKTAITCLTCHQPHAGGATAMLVGDTRPNLQFCRNCHKGMIAGEGQ